MIAFFAVFVHHVPSYDADHNCHHLPHGPTTSQVAYLRGSGGIEYDLHEVAGEPVLDFNFVFRNEVDTSTISLYVGCGGCASERPFHWDEPRSLPLDLPAYYHPAKFEPFTQHAYYELVPKGDGAPGAPAAQASSAFAQRAGANLEFHDLSLKLKEKVILKSVWGGVMGGEAGCILGESGAGKTSLLNALAGRLGARSGFDMSGVVALGGRRVAPRQIRKQLAYVEQSDETVLATATPREAFEAAYVAATPPGDWETPAPGGRRRLGRARRRRTSRA